MNGFDAKADGQGHKVRVVGGGGGLSLVVAGGASKMAVSVVA